MKKLLITLTVLTALVSCKESGTKMQKKEAVITGKITAIDSIAVPENLTAYLYNETIADYDQVEIEVNEDGTFTGNISIDKPKSIAIYGDFGTQLIAVPGDSIHIETNTRFEQVIYSGNSGDLNTALDEYVENNPANNMMKGAETLNLEDYEIRIQETDAAVKKYNAEFLAANNDQILKDYVTSEELFFVPATKLSYALFSRKGQEALKNQDFMATLNSLPEYKEAYDINNNNPGMLMNYIGYAWERDVKENSDEAREKAFMDGLMGLQNNEYLKKKILQSKVMNKLEDNNLSFYENNKETIETVFSGTTISNTVATKYNEVKKLLDNPEIPEDAELLTFNAEDPTKFIDEIIANANGKVVYIDNWATWCGPCKSEFKNASPQLHEKFKEDVEFVYLCHNSKEAGYVPSIVKYQIAGKHYFLTDKQSQPIFKQINLEGFPTYTIINKQGEIVLSDYIHRPSYAKTTDILTELVNEEI